MIFLAIEIFIGVCVRDHLVRPYLGDVLVVVLIYCALRVVFPKGIKLLPLYVFMFALSVELLQLFDIVGILGIPPGSFVGVVIGSTFSFPDVICYAVGCAFVGIVEAIRKKHS